MGTGDSAWVKWGGWSFLDRQRPDPVLRPPVRGIDIADIQAYDLGQPEPCSQGQGVDQAVAGIAARGKEDGPLFTMGRNLYSTENPRNEMSEV